MKFNSILLASALVFSLAACQQKTAETTSASVGNDSNFVVQAESFADLQILRYQIPGFNELSLQQKKLAYYLYEAGLSGRDIFYDQRGKYNLLIRKTIENIYGTY